MYLRMVLAAALLPAVVLMVLIYRLDRVEREPIGLLLALAAAGAFACIPASLIESFLMAFVQRAVSGETLAFVEAFFVVALAEEGCKLFFLKKLSWRSPAFDYRFDGIVYAVAVSLGFAALENVMYISSFGLELAVSRGLLAVPGHMTFSVFMGLAYGDAKQFEADGDEANRRGSMRRALLVPMLLHGFYDYCLMSGSEILALVFFGFVVALDVAAWRTVRGRSGRDAPITRRFF